MENLNLRNLNVYKISSDEKGFLEKLQKSAQVLKAEINSDLVRTVVEKTIHYYYKRRYR